MECQKCFISHEIWIPKNTIITSWNIMSGFCCRCLGSLRCWKSLEATRAKYVSICLLCQVLRSLRAPKRGKKTATENSFAASQLTLVWWYVDAAVQSSEALLGRKGIWLVSLKVLYGLYMGFIFPKKVHRRLVIFGNRMQQEWFFGTWSIQGFTFVPSQSTIHVGKYTSPLHCMGT